MERNALRILGARLLVEISKPREYYGLIYIPEGQRDHPCDGRVLARGPGEKNKHGMLQPIDEQIAVGARICFPKFQGEPIDFNDGKKVILIHEEDIIGIVD